MEPKLEHVGTQEFLGNTKTKNRGANSKRWVFTFNNYDKDEQFKNGTLFRVLKELCNVAIIGQEVGESGTPHLQGYVEVSMRCRPIEKFKLSKCIHWEPAKGTQEENKSYCSKEGVVILMFGFPEEIRVITHLRAWQEEIVKCVEEQPDDRTVRWYHESKGGIGKSALVKLLCYKYGAICCSGKASDMKYAIMKHKETHKVFPRIVIFDIPRSSLDYVSYQGIEEIKNGCFSSTKYECNMCIMNSPHVLVFANEPPNEDRLSKDRWFIKQLD